MEVYRYMYRCMCAGGSGWKCTGTCIGVCGREGQYVRTSVFNTLIPALTTAIVINVAQWHPILQEESFSKHSVCCYIHSLIQC